MGNQFLDQYSILHFAAGVVAYFWGIPALSWMGLHVSFEFLENTQVGMRFINDYLWFWPGGKPRADALINVVGDNISALCGWYVASALDQYGLKNNWYNK